MCCKGRLEPLHTNEAPGEGVAATRARHWLGLVLLSGLIFIASLNTIRSYDYFWHLATGRWIVEQRALPLTDPFSVGSDPIEWINGEWLFQIVLYLLYRLAGHEGVSLLRALLLAAGFGAIYHRASRIVAPGIAAFLTAIGWLGALHRLNARPETPATFLLVLFVAVLFFMKGRRRLVAATLVTILWFNIHPSALLAPILAGIHQGCELLLAGFRENRKQLTARALLILGPLLGLLVTPHGLKGVLAPLRLIGYASEGSFTNIEWVSSDPRLFPLLYLAVLSIVLLSLAPFREMRQKLPFGMIGLFLGILAIRYVRNQGLFFAAFPLIGAGLIRSDIPRRWNLVFAGASAAVVATVLAGQPWTDIGIDHSLFPIAATEQLKRSGFHGNIYNPDQFGGFLIWSFYPERRVVTDGRNELHRTWIPAYAQARVDSRAWNRLLQRYGLSLAVDEYRGALVPVVDTRTGRTVAQAASRTYFPRSRWALIAFDDAGLVFARRDAYPSEVIARLEYHHLVPDDPRPMKFDSDEQRNAAASELKRAAEALGPTPVMRRLIQSFQQGVVNSRAPGAG